MTAQTQKIGDIAVTALSDGVLTTSLYVVLGMDQAENERLAGIKATDPVPISVNAFMLKRGQKYALIDAGSGNTMDLRSASSPRICARSGWRRSRSTRSS